MRKYEIYHDTAMTLADFGDEEKRIGKAARANEIFKTAHQFEQYAIEEAIKENVGPFSIGILEDSARSLAEIAEAK